MSDEVPVLSISPRSLARVSATEEPDLETMKEPKGHFVPFLSEFCLLAGITDNEKAEIPTLSKFITAQSTDSGCRTASMPVGKPITLFRIDSDGVLVRVFSLGGASQRVVPATLRPRFPHLCHYSLLVSYPGKRRMYVTVRKELY